MIHGHGDDTYRFGSKIRINFSTNIPNVSHPGLEKHLASHIHIISCYPDPSAGALTSRIAEVSGIGIDNILVTNGAVDAIYSIAQMYAGRRSAIIAPTFSEYADAAHIYRHTVRYIDSVDRLPDVDVLWICNPCNPTGSFIPADRLLRIIDSHPDTLFVIDQAYEDYVVDDCISDREVTERSNIVVLHSMTKRYHIPGLRIAYAVAHSDIIGRLKQYRMPWSVNSLAIEAAMYALDHPDEFNMDTVSMVAEQRRVAARLRESCIETFPSETNFVLARLPHGTAAALKQWLVDEYGMLIRDASNFYGLTDAHFRIAVQRREDNDMLITAIQQWLHRS